MQNRLLSPILIVMFALSISMNQTYAQQIEPSEAGVIDATNAASLRLMAYRSFAGAQEVAWSPGSSLLAVSAGRRLFVFDTSDLSAPPIEFVHGGEVIDLAWSPDGRILAAASRDGRVRLWAISTRQLLHHKSFEARDIAYSPDGSVIAYVDYDHATVHVWNTLRDRMVTLEDAVESILPGTGVAFSPDGSRLVAGRPDGHMLIWNVLSGDLIRRVEVGQLPANGGGGLLVSPNDGTAYSPDDRRIAVASTRQPRSILIADPETGEIVHELIEPGGGLRKTFISVSFNATGDLLAAAGGDFEGDPVNDGITLWNLDDGAVVNTLSHPDVRSLAFSPDGSQMISAGGDELRLWRLRDDLLTPARGREQTDWLVDAFCRGDAPQFEARPGDTVGVGWSWFAIAPDLIDDHIASAVYEITLDDQSLENWVFLTVPQMASEFFDNWTVYYFMPLGQLEPGQHSTGYRVGWQWMINDGFDIYGPGTRNPEQRGQCLFTVNDR